MIGSSYEQPSDIPGSKYSEDDENHHPRSDNADTRDVSGHHGRGGVEDEQGHPRVRDVVRRNLVPTRHHRSILVVAQQLDKSIRHKLWAHEASHVLLHLGQLVLGASSQYGGLGYTWTQTQD